MKKRIPHIALSICLAALLLSLSGCSSTRTENGATIEKKGTYNPFNYIPGL